ncbi:MAG: glycosyltransferase [bacterium]
MKRVLKDYQGILGERSVAQLRQLATEIKGARVVHVNSTREGGGVAEILDWLCSLMNDLDLDTSWEVVEGHSDYFRTTKAFHNGLQGQNVPLSKSMIDSYEETLEDNAERLRPILEEADYVFIHDPQPALLLKLCPNRRGKWFWRCHIDASQPNRKIWSYIKNMVTDYDASVFSMPDFAHSLPHPQFIIAPSIDPLSDKNCELPQTEIDKRLEELDIPRDLPILAQISRFDRFKDPIGVIEAFKLVSSSTRARLVLAGGGATDDPEGAAVLEEVREAAADCENCHVLMLPSDAHRTINALQRASSIVIQKSTQEGFGLTVTEAMWKGRPVIGGNVGGIHLQVHNHHTGFLVNSPEGAALKIMELLRAPSKMSFIGETARQFVRDNFLLNRHLREYLVLMAGVHRKFENHLITH